MTPRFKRLPKCNYRTRLDEFWSKLLTNDTTRSICGNTHKIPTCPLRDEPDDELGMARCNLKGCGMKGYRCACCYFCRKSRKERLGK